MGKAFLWVLAAFLVFLLTLGKVALWVSRKVTGKR